MRFSSMSMPGSRATSEPVAMTMVFGLQRLRLAVVGFHLDLAGRGDAAGAAKRLDLVLLEQEVDALDVAVDVLVLVFDHRGEIDAGLADLDAHLAELVAGLLVELGGVQQRLGGNAADIEAGAAEGRVLLDHRGLEPELRRADGADIAAGAGADNDEIVGHSAAITFFAARPVRIPGLSVLKDWMQRSI